MYFHVLFLLIVILNNHIDRSSDAIRKRGPLIKQRSHLTSGMCRARKDILHGLFIGINLSKERLGPSPT